ncbi:hypothetical protein DITRI_Ditri03aG0193100 [Diplodiscus trichospermus]
MAKVKEFGYWVDNNWQWKIILRNRLFNWEVQQWEELCSVLKDECICDKLSVAFIWKHSTTGGYSTKSFCKKVLLDYYPIQCVWKQLWAGLAPPKVENFLLAGVNGQGCSKRTIGHKGNDMIFNGKLFDYQQLIDTIKFRVAAWSKAKWPDMQDGVLDVFWSPNLTKIPSKSKTANLELVETSNGCFEV